MSNHLSSSVLNALADGDILPDQLDATNRHLAECPSCASNALQQNLLKSATAKAGQRYTPPPGFQERVVRKARQELSAESSSRRGTAGPAKGGLSFQRWATACALLILCFGVILMQKTRSRNAIVSSENRAIATEAYDQHIAVLASNAPPQVISSDRHTVKPWFQGKLPFSFNLPEDLPTGTTLDGANFTYIRNRPAAHLIYSIGKHRVSIYLEQRLATEPAKNFTTDQSGFHVNLFSTDEISGVAVSDVDPSRLSELVSKLAQAQGK